MTGPRPHAVVWTARRVKQWRRTGKRPAVAVWTPAQTRRCLGSIAGHPLYTAFLVMALCGLRRGEACGLRWSDLDLDAGLAYVSQQVQRMKGVITACPLKTPTSRRAVSLSPEIVTALRALRQAQVEYARANGIPPSRYVFPGPGGGPLSTDYLTRTFGRLVTAARLILSHARSGVVTDGNRFAWSHKPRQKKNVGYKTPGQTGCAARDLNPEPAD